MIEISNFDLSVKFDEVNLDFTIIKNNTTWNFTKNEKPYFLVDDERVDFITAKSIKHEKVFNGVGSGIRSIYSDFTIKGQLSKLAFETYVWIENTTNHLYFEWIPVCEEGISIKNVYWPVAMEFDEPKDTWYTLVNMQQGIMIPNTWENELKEISFNGMFLTAGGYMPWFSQIKDKKGYIAISITPWNDAYDAHHPKGGGFTHINIRHDQSLGKMDYKRVLRYTFLDDCDHNDMCKVYRRYVDECGHLRTLKEKAVKNPHINQLVGSMILHKGIKTSVREDSDFFDPANPDKNNRVVSFKQREDEILEIYNKGVKKIYMHLDGCSKAGYDNDHPDFYLACEEAGGIDAMKSLVDTMHKCGYMFGTHDQYRDYYKSAKSFDRDYACQLIDGSIPEHSRWAGGPQSYLCGTQAKHYVKRNFSLIKEQGIDLDCTYLDVFTCNEGDECDNHRHKMTRRDCYEERAKCFHYLLSKGILTSSEEVSDWCIESMILCHYAPYDFMLRTPGEPKQGIPVPLFNLVYHDCLIQPFMMDKVSEDEDYMLYALLNAGAPYLVRDPAYANIDGAFENTVPITLDEQIKRCEVVANLHEKVATSELVRYEVSGDNYNIHKSIFDNGVEVLVDFDKQTYEIKGM